MPLLATALSTEWTPNIGLVMILCNLFVISIGRFVIQNPGQSPALPVQLPGLFEGFGWAELLGTMSLGHVLGAGMILGLASAGVL